MSADEFIRAAKQRVAAAHQSFQKSLRERTLYSRRRLAVIAAFLGVSVVTAVIVFARAPSNHLQAQVQLGRAELVIGDFVLIHNRSSQDWRDVNLAIDGTFTWNFKRLKAGDRITIQLARFRSGANNKIQRPNAAHVRELRIECDRGSETYPLREQE